MAQMTEKVRKALDRQLSYRNPFTYEDLLVASDREVRPEMLRDSFLNGGSKWAGWAAIYADPMPRPLSFAPNGPLVFFYLEDGYSEPLKRLLRLHKGPNFGATGDYMGRLLEEKIPMDGPKTAPNNTHAPVSMSDTSGKKSNRHSCTCGKSYSRSRDLNRHIKKEG